MKLILRYILCILGIVTSFLLWTGGLHMIGILIKHGIDSLLTVLTVLLFLVVGSVLAFSSGYYFVARPGDT